MAKKLALVGEVAFRLPREAYKGRTWPLAVNVGPDDLPALRSLVAKMGWRLAVSAERQIMARIERDGKAEVVDFLHRPSRKEQAALERIAKQEVSYAD